MNLYAFCGDNPVNFVDPLGLETREEIIIELVEGEYDLLSPLFSEKKDLLRFVAMYASIIERFSDKGLAEEFELAYGKKVNVDGGSGIGHWWSETVGKAKSGDAEALGEYKVYTGIIKTIEEEGYDYYRNFSKYDWRVGAKDRMLGQLYGYASVGMTISSEAVKTWLLNKGFTKILNIVGKIFVDLHHIIPKSILKQLKKGNPKLYYKVRGVRGNPNRIPIDRKFHRKVLHTGKGAKGGKFLKWWDEAIKRKGGRIRDLTYDDWMELKAEAIKYIETLL